MAIYFVSLQSEKSYEINVKAITVYGKKCGYLVAVSDKSVSRKTRHMT